MVDLIDFVVDIFLDKIDQLMPDLGFYFSDRHFLDPRFFNYIIFAQIGLVHIYEFELE